MPFNQSGSNNSTDLQGNCNDIQGDQDNMFIRTIMYSQNQTYYADIIIINMGSNSVAGPSVQQTLQPAARPSNKALSFAAQCPLQSWQQKVIAAANDTSGLIASIIHLLENHTEYFDSYQDLRLPVKLLHHMMMMNRLTTLKILGPCGHNQTSTIEQVVFECYETLQKLFVELEGHQGLRVTDILWNHVPRRFQRQELCQIKKRVKTHLVTLMKSLALTLYFDNFHHLHFASLPGVGK